LIIFFFLSVSQCASGVKGLRHVLVDCSRHAMGDKCQCARDGICSDSTVEKMAIKSTERNGDINRANMNVIQRRLVSDGAYFTPTYPTLGG
jgi:hypothetical protein